MLDKRPSVTAGPENQYVAVGHHCSLCLTPVDHMEKPFILRALLTGTQREQEILTATGQTLKNSV